MLLRYMIHRLSSIIPVLFIVSIIVFMLIHLTPGNPAFLILGEDSSEASIAQLEKQLGLDKPITIQFLNWLKNVVTGDLGQSIYSSEPVLEIILQRVGPTFSLMLVSMTIALAIAIPVAIFVVWKRNTVWDPLFIFTSLLGVSIPEFWLAMLLVLSVGVVIPLFPVAGYVPFMESIHLWFYHLFLPAIVLATIEIGLIARMIRDGMLDSIHQDYTRTVRAKGVKESIVLMKHVFSNALIPTTTVIGTMVAGLLGGAIIIETIFTIPGIGQLLIDSIHRRDYPVIQGVILIIACIYVLVNLIVDLLYTFLDPRIRYD